MQESQIKANTEVSIPKRVSEALNLITTIDNVHFALFQSLKGFQRL